MYNGWTEPQAQIEARQARNAARAAEAAKATAPAGHVLPPMTSTEWWALPAVVRYFHPEDRATQPLEILTTEGGK